MSVVVLLEMQIKPEAVNDVKAFMKDNLADTRGYDGCQGWMSMTTWTRPGTW